MRGFAADGPDNPPVRAPLGDQAGVEVVEQGGRTLVRVTGDLTLESAPAAFKAIRPLAGARRPVTLDVSNVPRCDSAAAAMVIALGGAPGVTVVGANEQVARVLRLAEKSAPDDEEPEPEEERKSVFGTVGATAHGLVVVTRDTFGYVGELASMICRSAVRPRSVRWRDVIHSMARTGPDALGIVGVIGFLMGWILAFQGAEQLGRFGIEVYTADAVGAAIVVELGPLMTAIVVAGRSGAAFAAEIGTMKVNEEIDALDTMGLDRMRFLVAPKVIALVLMMPLLVLFADACGVLGGMLVCTTSLDMTVSTYMRHTIDSVTLWTFTQGMIKGESYAIVIASVGCLRGLQTKQGAQGVGLATTSAVVTAILLLIVVDAILTTIFSVLGNAG
jgi:phospholipid/cholesterol/gamma-HCH transport system permease protein